MTECVDLQPWPVPRVRVVVVVVVIVATVTLAVAGLSPEAAVALVMAAGTAGVSLATRVAGVPAARLE